MTRRAGLAALVALVFVPATAAVPTIAPAAAQPAAQNRLGIPIIYGVDAVHGHNNVVGATIFPHNIGLGATRNPTLVQQIGRATAEEVSGTGIDWDFAPCLCVARNDRWGRTYESYSEDPAIASSMATYVTGLQGSSLNGTASVMATTCSPTATGSPRPTVVPSATSSGGRHTERMARPTSLPSLTVTPSDADLSRCCAASSPTATSSCSPSRQVTLPAPYRPAWRVLRNRRGSGPI